MKTDPQRGVSLIGTDYDRRGDEYPRDGTQNGRRRAGSPGSEGHLHPGLTAPL